MMYMYFEYWNVVNFRIVDTSGSFDKSWNVVNPHPVRYDYLFEIKSNCIQLLRLAKFVKIVNNIREHMF